MKQCPECRRNYFDETLNYCLEDGLALVLEPFVNESETAILPADLPSEAEYHEHSSVRRSESLSRPHAGQIASLFSGNTLLLTVLFPLVLIAAGFLVHRFWYPPGGKQIDSVAVMPFVNDSGNPDLEYLSDGMTETLIANLSQLPIVTVKARSSVFRYKGKNTDPKTIGSELSVQSVLNGRIVQRGQDLMLNVELIDARTENVLWSQNYSRRAADLVALQTDIARDVSEKLLTKLTGAQKVQLTKGYTANTAAYNLYLRGRYHFNKRTVKDLQSSIGYLQQAVAADPDYALAYAALADAYAVLPSYSGGPATETAPKAREAALRALAIDEDLSEAHASLALVMDGYDYDFRGAERELKRAIELDRKNAVALANYGHLLIQTGRFDDALAPLHQALDLEPLSLPINALYGSDMYLMRRYSESEEQLKKTIDLDPSFVLTHYYLGVVYRVQGRYGEAVESYARGLEAAGSQASADRARQVFSTKGWSGFQLFNLEDAAGTKLRYHAASVYADRGEKDLAIDALSQAIERHESLVAIMNVDPRWDSLRGDPAFQRLIDRVGFPQ